MRYRQNTKIKILAGVVFFVVILCSGSSSYAANSRVLVIPFENKTGGLEGTDKELTDVAIKQVRMSNNYTYISQDEFRKNWFGGLPKGAKEMLGIDIAEEFGDLEKLKPHFAHGSLGTVFEYKELWGVDLVILGEIRGESKFPQLYSEIISMDTGRFYSATTDCRPDELKDTAKKQVSSLLKKSGKVQTVEADAEIDHLWSIVCYNIKSLGGENIQIKADYTYARPNPALQNLDIILPQSLEEGPKIYKIQTKENKQIELTCSYKNGQPEHIKIFTSLPSDAAGNECTEVLSVVSQRGYVINFAFYWRGKTLENVKVEPLVNPYCPVD